MQNHFNATSNWITKLFLGEFEMKYTFEIEMNKMKLKTSPIQKTNIYENKNTVGWNEERERES